MSVKNPRVLIVSLFCLLLLPLLAACGSKSVKVEEGTADQTYVMNVNPSSMNAGEITFDIKNDAASETHEFVIVNTDLNAGSLPLDSEGNVDEEQIEVVDEAEDIAPGESKTLTVNLPAGHYALICNLPDHYGQGMHADFTVNP
ncbi:MAG: plastocyanin/azurin family copper-binding protein [Anaerolineales bacterium]|jgi:uncharacterized cupredoxin-like copper-binding protein